MSRHPGQSAAVLLEVRLVGRRNLYALELVRPDLIPICLEVSGRAALIDR
jgi:hypothetical protein